jgi:hypothetical protein
MHEDFEGFESWEDVMSWARRGLPLYYHAPLNICPVRLWHEAPTRAHATYLVRARTLRLTPPDAIGRGPERTADPFTADKKHLSRFKRPDKLFAEDMLNQWGK